MTMRQEPGRLMVREFITPYLSDVLALFAMTGDETVMRYMGFKRHTSLMQARELVERYVEHEAAKYLAVYRDGDPEDVLGVVGLEVQGHQAAITIMFRADFKARGAGREFAIPFVNWLLASNPAIKRVWAYCHVDNVPVQNLLRRMGAVREGRLRKFQFFPNISDEPQDCFIYSIIRS
jgi:ribosomal-protein-alanine N-acetyltransferase